MSEFVLKDSGQREDFATGSRRDSRDGKGRYDLLPPRAMRRVARHFENGARKYGDRNWEKGQPLSRFLDSGLRHCFARLEGKMDEDHLAALAWNALAAIETEERIKDGLLPADLDDLPRVQQGQTENIPDAEIIEMEARSGGCNCLACREFKALTSEEARLREACDCEICRAGNSGRD